MAETKVPEPIFEDEFQVDYAADGYDETAADEVFEDDVDEAEESDLELDEMPEEELWTALDNVRLKK